MSHEGNKPIQSDEDLVQESCSEIESFTRKISAGDLQKMAVGNSCSELKYLSNRSSG